MKNMYLTLAAFVLFSVGCSPPPSPVSTPADEQSSVASPPLDARSAESTPPELASAGTKTHSSTESLTEPPTEVDSSPQDTAPDDAMALYRKAQALMKEEKREEGYETAQKAMQQFIAEGNNLAWMILESIEVDGIRIDVHFNMSDQERRPPDIGIVRPLSFRIWANGDDPELLQILDFEIARSGGNSLTAAIGETTRTGRSNYGMLDVDSSYEAIRQRVIDLVTDR